nr:molybdopterin-dependent oxidoreductase [Bradyrhizobium diazoefficiens]
MSTVGHCFSDTCGACSRQPTICYMCSSECGIVTHVSDGKVVGIFGDVGHPMNAGKLCPKALAAPDLVHDPDRIRTPLRRTGPRGAGTFEPVSWEVALDDIARQLVAAKKAEGSQTLLVQFGEKPDHDLVYRFANAYGTPNVLDHDSICDTNRREGFMYTYGRSHFRPLIDLKRPLKTIDGIRHDHDCRYLFLVGENPFEATRFFYLRDGIRDALRSGMRLTVVDPFRSVTATHAHDWLPIRPGSDLALVLAMLRFIIERDDPSDPERRYLDWDFIRRHTVGFEELRQRLTAETDLFNLDWAAAITGLPAATIERVAHEFGSIKPAAAMVGMNAVGHHINGFDTTRAVAALIAITGNLDVPGGVCLSPLVAIDTKQVHGTDLLRPDLAEMHKDLFGGFPLAYRGIKAKVPLDLLDGVKLTHGTHAGEHYRIRSLFVIHGNPLINSPNTGRWHEALTKRDTSGNYAVPLVVFNDTQLNDTGLYADYVLPMASFLERQGLCRIYVPEPTLSLRDPALRPLHESRTPLGWLAPLAEACVLHGDREMAAAIPFVNDDEWCDAALRECPGLHGVPKGIAPDGEPLTVEWLRRHGGTVTWPARYRKFGEGSLDTPSGKVELRSGIIDLTNARFGTSYDSLVTYTENPWSPLHSASAKAATGYPFQLITGRSLLHTGAATQNLPRSLKSQSEPCIFLNPEDARRVGVEDHGWVVVRNPLGAEIRARVKLSAKIIAGVVRATHGWGQRTPHLRLARDRGYNVNRLTDDTAFNPVTGNAGFGDMMVNVVPEPFHDNLDTQSREMQS